MHLTPTLARTLLLAGGLAFATTAGAQESGSSPYYIGASQAMTYQANIYSTPNHPAPTTPPTLPVPCPTYAYPSNTETCPPINSWISTTSLVGGFDQPIGRQRVFLNGTVGYNYYLNDHVRLLNNTSYSVNAGVDWESIEKLSGTIRLYGNQSLGNYATADTATITQRNIQNLGQLAFTAQYGLGTRATADASYSYRRLMFSSDAYQNQEYSQNVFSFGGRYGHGGPLVAGVGLRYTKADYPKYAPNVVELEPPTNPPIFVQDGFLADEVTGKYVDFTASWTPSGLSVVDARVSLSDISHTLNTGGDYRGLTGALGWNYEPTGKIKTRVALIVAPGTGTTAANQVSGVNTIETSSLNTTLRLNGTYAATGKVSFNGNLTFSHNQYDSANLLENTDQQATALTSSAGLGVTYLPTRNSQLACNVTYVRRNVSQPAENSIFNLYAYYGSSFGCSAQLLLQ